MFFHHHGNFPTVPHHNSTGLPCGGMQQLMFGILIGQGLEEARERHAHSTDCKECDKCGKGHK